MLKRQVAFLGAGNMAEAMIKGLLRGGTAQAREISATARRPERQSALHASYGIQVTTDNLAAARAADVVILAVKPQAMDKLVTEIAPAIDPHKLVISIAAGVPIAALARRL